MKVHLTEKHTVFNYSEPYVIAEIGANHNGDMNLAKKILKQCKKQIKKQIKHLKN